MRSFVLVSFAALLFSATLGVQSMPTGTEDLDDCAPTISVQARELLKAPVFWTGKSGRKGAKQVADILQKDTSIVGTQGGFTIFDALKDAGVSTTETAKWKPETDWRAVCGAFAQYAKPTDKKAHLVYGPEYDKTKNIWSDDEWPALEKNSAVTEVLTYKMKPDGKTWTEKGEIKASKKGSPIHSANSSPHVSDEE
ncbi:hypothetical protein J3R30DRAFT_3481080 [Lentinula aciculospora]|uniref:Uncharacterized protein n=1 Tax=Lentinula aciculospora TaxID=153920 RepID=A0A9W9DNQ7_9AGAR|nr:hypothetical protein J3R30DRAFT_3481080 [Lentinula aciculospora]